MEPLDAINYIRELLTKLHANPNIYEDGSCNFIAALEEGALPALQKEIPMYVNINRSLGTSCGREYYACPNCGEYIRYVYTLEPPTYPCRCDECGQALDWDLYL